MRIKHFAGYGCVNMKLQGKGHGNGNTVLKVLVSGNHERGLIRPCATNYDIHEWIGKHFVKDKTWHDLVWYGHTGYNTHKNSKGLDEEFTVYTLIYE